MAHPAGAALAPWSLEPLLAAGLVLAAGAYALGRHRLRRRARGRAALPAWRTGCYAGGVAALALATLSPLAEAGERRFAVHMVQHLLLILVVPPLLWLGAPLVPSLWGLPRPLRRGFGRLLAPGRPVARLCHALVRPAVGATLHVGVVAAWHLPALYDAAQGPTLLHDLEHLLFLGTALLYWWPLVYPAPGTRPLTREGGLLHLLPPMLASDLLGALLAFAPVPLYGTYLAAGATPALADQRAGGLIMWWGGGLLWLGAMAAVFVAPLDRERISHATRSVGGRGGETRCRPG